jgi:tetratricopeptide (TPR) repeat protein
VEDLSEVDLCASPLFRDLLVSVPLARSATRLGQAGTALANSGKAVKSERYLQGALFIAHDVPGWAERATVWFNLGVLLRAPGRYDDALRAFAECQAAAVAMNDRSNQGRGLAMTGDVCLKAGAPSKSVEPLLASLLASLLPLEAAHDSEHIARSLQLLSQAYQAIGDAAKSKAAQTELRRLNTDGTWSGSSALLQELSNVAHSAD